MNQPAPVTPIAAGRQTPRRLRRASEIVDAAREVFLDKGFERSSVAEIAARVGVVEGLVYTYFPTKRDLLNEVLRGMYVPLLRDIDNGFSRILGLRSRLRFLIWRQLRVFVEEPGLSRIALHEVRTGPDYFQSVLHDLQVQYTDFLMRTVRDAVRDGELPPDTDAEMIRSVVYGGIEHRMWATLSGRGSVDIEATADRFTALVLRGILPEEPPAASASLEQRVVRLEALAAATTGFATAPATAPTAASATPPPPTPQARRRRRTP